MCRMSTPEGQSIYSKRKSTMEPVFGVIKQVVGFRRFHLRGFNAVRDEWNLVCMASNAPTDLCLVSCFID